MKKVEIIYGSIIEQIKILAGGDKAKAAEAIGMFALYDYEGEEYDGDNILVKMAFAGAKPMKDLHEARALAGAKGGAIGGARSHGGGAPIGNQNAYKNNKAKQQSKISRGENTPLENNKANNKQSFEQGCNSLNNNELQGIENNKAKQQSKQSKPSMIREDIDIESLDNTSPLTELVLSKKEKINKKEKSETAPATLEGGAAPSFSETRNDFSRDYNARVSAMIERGVSAMPQTSSANSHSLQTPPPPTPPAEPRRRVGFAGNVAMSEDERANIEAQVRANIQAQRDAERNATDKDELPPAASNIKPVIDDSDTAQQARETKRIHDIQHLIEMADTEEEREALHAYL